MRDVTIAIIAASWHGNKGAAAMLQSSIQQLYARYGSALNINLMSVYPRSDKQLSPFDFVRVVSCKPEELVFLAFPLAILYWLFRWLPPARALLGRHKIIKAYLGTNLVIDEAGVAFVDSRGFVMNLYAFITNAVPLLLGVPVVKYSQALGAFSSKTNRFLAKWILPKLKLICARGQITLQHLAGIGIRDNVVLCADGAFSMPDAAAIEAEVAALWASDDFYQNDVIALSLSCVVEGKCSAMGIDYRGIMAGFVDALSARGFSVLLIANAARLGSEKLRNNDLMVCDAVYAAAKDKTRLRWYHEEMPPEKIRALLGRCRLLVAARFHAMIGALEKGVPTLLVGWSHKYKEVLDLFGLGECAVDFSALSADMLLQRFDETLAQEADIRAAIAAHLAAVLESSRQNIARIAHILDTDILPEPQKRKKLFDYTQPQHYLGPVLTCRMGYAASEALRGQAASGGTVTALLCHLLRTGQIDGAWVTRSHIAGGQLGYETFIATTEAEIQSASTSIYMDMPLLHHLDILRAFSGRAAVVLLPCQMRALSAILEKDAALREKVVLKISLYCSGSHDKMATLLPLKKKGISLQNATRFIYRRGHWRGTSIVQYADGTRQTLSYTKMLLPYKNAYFFAARRCMLCQNHFGRDADLSFGDVWLKEMKSNPVKHTAGILRTPQGQALYQSAVAAGVLADTHLSQTKAIKSQKRALVFKYNCAAAKQHYYAKQGRALQLDTQNRCKWNHRLAWFLARRNQAWSEAHPEKLEKFPLPLLYGYMLFIRVLLNF